MLKLQILHQVYFIVVITPFVHNNSLKYIKNYEIETSWNLSSNFAGLFCFAFNAIYLFFILNKICFSFTVHFVLPMWCFIGLLYMNHKWVTLWLDKIMKKKIRIDKNMNTCKLLQISFKTFLLLLFINIVYNLVLHNFLVE